MNFFGLLRRRLVGGMCLLPVYFLISCDIISPVSPLSVPDTYDGTTFTRNAEGELRLMAAFDSLSKTMKTGRTPGTTVSIAGLRSIFTTSFGSGAPSLSEASLPFGRERIDVFLGELAAASGNVYDTQKTPMQNGQGGIAGSAARYLVDEYGVEHVELVDKTIFGNIFFHRASVLLSGEISQSDIDRALALFGATPEFKNSDNSTKHGASADRAGAGYAARRDDNTGTGFYRTVQKNFIKLQAAVKAGSRYTKERDEAVTAILTAWEQSAAACVINYSFATIANLTKSEIPTDDRARILHTYAEATGFLHGLRTVPGKKISDTKLDELLALLYIRPGENVYEAYRVLQDPVTAAQNFGTVIGQLKATYGFTDAHIEQFKRNFVSDQMR